MFFSIINNLIKYGNYVEMRINNGVKIQSVKMNASWLVDKYYVHNIQIPNITFSVLKVIYVQHGVKD